MLKDPAIIARIKSNPEIQKLILSDYTQQVNADKKPIVMGGKWRRKTSHTATDGDQIDERGLQGRCKFLQ